jgi:oxygen-independent coproporphyrinogen-3 oxidase
VTEKNPISLPVQTGPTRPSAREVLGRLPEPPPPVERLYIHVPFCFHKCHYCDFYSLVDTRDRQPAFVKRLTDELAAQAPLAGPLKSIFVGGGTPSLLAPHLWRALLATLAERFDLGPIRAGMGEFTVECNPETVTPQLMDVFAAGGVNRVSVGAQSFNPAHLKTLERWHDPANVSRAVEMARAAGIGRQSVDLIFAIPGQTLDEWQTDLATALALGTEHISAYALTFEPGTAMTARLARGEFPKADEDIEADMFEATLATLRAAGLDRYEVSNFARPGAECAHNLGYWRQEQWLAAGPAASGHVGGARWKNVPRLDDYLEQSDAGFAPVMDIEMPDARRALVERIMTGLRLREGVNGAALAETVEKLNPGAGERLRAKAAAFAGQGLLVMGLTEQGVEAEDRRGPPGHPRHDERCHWSLTDRGLLIADGIVRGLVGVLGF